MMTVVDPGGTPTPVYNQDGVTIAAITATASPGSPTPIVSYSVTTVVLVTATNTSDAVILPSSAQIGDVVEIGVSSGNGFATVVPDSGSEINGNGTNVGVHIRSGILRKLSATKWYGPVVV